MAIQKNSFMDSDRSEMELSDDLLAEIILRLPLESVARSKCVSKNWCATVSDDYLRHRLPLHMSMICFPDGDGDGDRPVYACAADGRRLEDCDMGFFPLHESTVVLDGCNGLLLCRAPGTPEFYVVCPVTRRWVALPRPAKEARLSMLAYDPSGSTRHYHVINFTGWRERGAAVEVFSSETWAWAARDPEFGVSAGSLSSSMHYHDGAVYVLASDPDCVVRMDVAAGLTCTAIHLPEPAIYGDGRVAHCGGRLHYVCSDGELLKVWSLEDGPADHYQWRLKYAVRVDVDVGDGSGGGEVRFLALHPEKDAVVYVWSPWKVVEYDLSRRQTTGVAWEFAKGARNRVVKTWLVPSSCYLSERLADGPYAINWIFFFNRVTHFH